MASRKNVKCNNCGHITGIRIKTTRIKEIEYKYFRCRKCKQVYVISATDEELRKNILRYQNLVNSVDDKQIVPPEVQQEAELLLRVNVERSKQIRQQYPLYL